MLVESRERGFGRVRAASGDSVEVAYFDVPGPDGIAVVEEDIGDLRRGVLPPQTRVHWRGTAGWEHGRVLDHHPDTGHVLVRVAHEQRLVADSEIVVRWRQPIVDASRLLADRWVESRRFHDGRHAFVQAYAARASAYQGMTAISSSSIEAHPHQIEAVRRVLSDAIPRYLLADEVGLGKTIEAGLLVRQHLLDSRRHRALVLVPPALERQWEEEMESKFRLVSEFESAFELRSFDYLADAAPPSGFSLVVVDEAHRVTERGEDAPEYRALCALADDAHALLLLSATPLLQQPASLQRLLSLLAPGARAFTDPAAFALVLASRDEIGRYYGSLRADIAPAFLRQAIAGLRTLLADDPHLQILLDNVDAALASSDHQRLDVAVRGARSHISEAHRIYSRMIRTRRGTGLAEDFPVLGRAMPTPVYVTGAVATVGEAYAAWHDHVLARLERTVDVGGEELIAAAAGIVERLSAAGDQLVTAVVARLNEAGRSAPDEEERELLDALRASAQERAEDCPRLRLVIEQAVRLVSEGERLVIVTATESCAQQIFARLEHEDLRAPLLILDGHAPGAVRAFSEADGGAVLVIGPRGEEGQNLQAASAVLHVELPWDPNRLEQRLGRFDRFGAGVAARQFVLLDDAGTPHNGWYDLVCNGFGVFRESIASLQLAIARMMPRLIEAGVRGGADGLRAQEGWVAEQLETELGAVQLAELLDETVVDDRGLRLVETVEEAELSAVTLAWQESVIRWSAGDGSSAAHLRFHHEELAGLHRFALTRFQNPNLAALSDSDLPLVAWSDLGERFGAAMSGGSVQGTFRRVAASRRGLELFGPGDPFIDALLEFTEFDDRGRAFTLWRARDFWHGQPEFFAVCFDVRIRPEVGTALAVASALHPISPDAVRRRAQSYLAPTISRVWLDTTLSEVADPKRLQILNAPYDELREDKTIRPEQWARIDEHIDRAEWPAWCAKATKQAIAIAFGRDDLRERCAAAAASATRDCEEALARLEARTDAASRDAETVERVLGPALSKGLARPVAGIDAAGIVIVSSEPLPRDEYW
jgi:ATP-dependent helicase HepA